MRNSEAKQITPEEANSLAKERLRTWLRLFSATGLVEGEIRRRLRASFDTTLPQFDFMAALYKAKTPPSMGELSAELLVTNGNVTGLADRLEKAGLIQRIRSDDDRRTTRLVLTDQGRSAFEDMAGTHETWIDELFGVLDHDQLNALDTLLTELKRPFVDEIEEIEVRQRSAS